MKKQTKTILVGAVVFVLFLGSCNEDKCCKRGLSRGVLSKDWIYTNDSLKLKLKLPSSWYMEVGSGYLPLSVDNEKMYSTDYIYSVAELKKADDHPILQIEELFKIILTPPTVTGNIDGAIIRFRLTKSTSTYHTAQEDVDQLIKDCIEANLLEEVKPPNTQRIEKIDLPQGNTFHYVSIGSLMTHKSMVVGIIHKDCYNLRVEIADNDYQSLQQTLNIFQSLWLEY